jgi:hypothetical protein
VLAGAAAAAGVVSFVVYDVGITGTVAGAVAGAGWLSAVW